MNANASDPPLVSTDHYMELDASNVLWISPKDCGMTRRRKLLLGAESERGTIVLGRPFYRPFMEPSRDLTPQATFPADVCTLLLPRSVLSRNQLNLYGQGCVSKEAGTMAT